MDATAAIVKIYFEILLLNAKGQLTQNLEGSIGATIGIKHGFSCINIRQVPWEVLKTKAEGRSFQHLPRDLANVNALKKQV